MLGQSLALLYPASAVLSPSPHCHAHLVVVPQLLSCAGTCPVLVFASHHCCHQWWCCCWPRCGYSHAPWCTGMSLTTWKTEWIYDINGGSLRWYGCEPTGRTIGYGPRYRCANFFVGLVVLISEASRKTFLPTVNFGAGVRC